MSLYNDNKATLYYFMLCIERSIYVTELQEYKCPCCGGAIAFDSTSQKMKCPYCDTEFDVETLVNYDDELKSEQKDDMKWETSSKEEWEQNEINDLRGYVCKSCGGEITCDKNTVATSCPFCGNAVVMMEQLSNVRKPDYVIPFQLDKKAAETALKKHYEGKCLLPKVFKDQNHIEEVKGIYIPFWLFHADADVAIRYKATKVRTWSDSKYYYTETSFFSVSRNGSIAFERVPVDGSTKMPDDLMESLEPFDFSKAVDFQTAYLAGYLADKYDVDDEKSIKRANERIQKSAEKAFDATVQGYTSVLKENSSIQLHNGEVKYALFPVWLLTTKWNGQNYIFAMNGQNGKMVGDLPLDKSAYKKWIFVLTILIGILLYALSYLIWLL